MLYLDIVINELKSIILFEKYFFSITCISLLVFFYFLYKNIFSSNYKYKVIILIRLLFIILLLPLINNKIHNKTETSLRNQNISIIIDNSKSLDHISKKDSINFKNIFNLINDWSKKYEINLKWHNLDNDIQDYKSIKFDKENTTFSNIKNIVQKNESDQIIIFSDGNINTDYISNDLFLPEYKKVHTIGIGKIKDNMDIGVQDVNLNTSKDSINIDIVFSANISKDAIFKLNILSDNNIINIDTIRVKEGEYFFEKTYIFKSNVFSKDIQVNISPINFNDLIIHNNKWVIKNRYQQNLKLLLISNSLSYNTMFIKNLISSIDLIELEHLYKFDENFLLNKYSFNDFDGIILDNFPNNLSDYDYLKNKFVDKIPYFFIEGYELNPEYIVKFINEKFQAKLNFNDNSYPKSILINNEKNISNIMSLFNIYSSEQIDLSENFHYNNKSLYQIHKKNFLGLFIPNLSEISFYLKNKYEDLYLEKYIKYLIDIHFGQNNLYKLNLDKKNYLIGDKLQINIINTLSNEQKEQKLIIKNINNNQIDTINNNITSDIILSKSGNYEIYSLYQGTNTKQINSNKETFFVENKSIESDQVSQNKYLLNSISSKYNGLYVDAKNLNETWLSKIENKKVITNSKKIYTSLEIFIKEKFFLLVLILFCFEIYLRKKTGLL
ncbi:MAG: hypothetical protein CBD26_03045 [Candidatus Pelagibacter sp. TMED166]|nr:MAG: hypothetical protein CBD26_03045 [Candidatus Pelagibacter sp. TMED166]